MLTLQIQQQKYVGCWIKREYFIIYYKFGYVYEYLFTTCFNEKNGKIMLAT